MKKYVKCGTGPKGGWLRLVITVPNLTSHMRLSQHILHNLTKKNKKNITKTHSLCVNLTVIFPI